MKTISHKEKLSIEMYIEHIKLEKEMEFVKALSACECNKKIGEFF